jgi:hypothetical protein
MENKRKHVQFEEDGAQFDGDAMELPIVRITSPLIGEGMPANSKKVPYLDQSIEIIKQVQAKHPILKPLYKLICSHSFSTQSKITLDILDLLAATYKVMLSQIMQSQPKIIS